MKTVIMASINLDELQPVGSELFQNPESFIHDLNNFDDYISGGYNFSNYHSQDNIVDFTIKVLEFTIITYSINAILQLTESFSNDNNGI